MSQNIKNHLNASFDFYGKNVSLFRGIDAKNEVRTCGFFDLENTAVYAPRTAPKNELIHIRATAKTKWETNEWGIEEPVLDANILPPKDFDYVIVPLFVIDKRGYRLGYGGGYYDRFLAKCSKDCIFVGVGHFQTIDEITEINQFDIPLDYYVSPEQLTIF